MNERTTPAPAASPEPEDVWTVIGVWDESEPITTGTVKGSRAGYGGNGSYFGQGCWATSVTAPDVAEAERLAVAEMRESMGEDAGKGEDCNQPPARHPEPVSAPIGEQDIAPLSDRDHSQCNHQRGWWPCAAKAADLT